MSNELFHANQDLEVRFWCDRAYAARARRIFEFGEGEVAVQTVKAGKFRRYYGVSFIRQLFDLPTLILNMIDIVIIFVGFLQSLGRLLVWRPQVIFLKGGFVCLPVGYAAMLLRIPFVIHDSDAHPGLTNRLLAPHATKIATGAPLEYYHYPQEKAQYVGIPVQSENKVYTSDEKRALKKALQVPENEPLLLVTGGGLGAKRINDALVAVAPTLLKRTSIIHLSGNLHYDTLKAQVPQDERYKLIAFVDNARYMAQIIGAADVVITRAGATSMAELACAGAVTIIIPNKQLTGGHQIKNAQVYTDAQAAVSLDEDSLVATPTLVSDTVIELLNDSEKRQAMSRTIVQFAMPNAARDVAVLIQQVGKL